VNALKPVIGITCSYSWDREVYLIRENYVEAVVRSGGIPIILPATENADINKIISMIDGLLLSGGGDLYLLLHLKVIHQSLKLSC